LAGNRIKKKKKMLLSTQFSKTLSLCSSLNVRCQVSNSCKKTHKIIVLEVLNFSFLDSSQGSK
jgi:hypothetical protein